MQSKITVLTPEGTYQTGRGDTMYKFQVTLEDGTHGEVSAKTQDRWSVGDEVEYTQQSTNWGPKLKLQRPGMAGGPGASGGRDVSGQIASWAVGAAVNSLPPLSNVNEIEVQQYREQVEKIAQSLLAARVNLKPFSQP